MKTTARRGVPRRTFLRTATACVGFICPRLLVPSRFTELGQPVSVHSARATQLTISEASELVRTKKLSPVELTQDCLSRIERLNPKLNAFITLTADFALTDARRAEAEILKGQLRGPLHGIPIALKDLIDTAGVRTTAGSGLFKDRVPTQDAEVVRRLKSAGAVFLGKLNMHEFAYGGSSAISYFGAVHNPWAPEFCPGGSSGGSAAAVAAGLCLGSVGSDTGGSVRQPSAYCGIVGLKPTYGRVSTTGSVPLSWSLDHLGPMTRSVRDAAILFQAISGYDLKDVASVDIPVADCVASLSAGVSSLRLGILRPHFYDELDPEILNVVNSALADFRKLTAEQRDLGAPTENDFYSAIVDTGFNVLLAEAYAYHQEYVAKSPDLYQAPTIKRIQNGSQISSVAYVNSRRKLDELRRSARQLFDSVDLLVTPTTPVPPFSIEDLLADQNTMRAKEVLMLRNTRPFNVLGLPTISVPCGFTSHGLPVGIQISGPPWGEATLLRLAQAYEHATSWHKQMPVVS